MNKKIGCLIVHLAMILSMPAAAGTVEHCPVGMGAFPSVDQMIAQLESAPPAAGVASAEQDSYAYSEWAEWGDREKD